MLLWLQAVREHLFDRSLIPVPSAHRHQAWGDLTLRVPCGLGMASVPLAPPSAEAAHAGTSLANDYGDHVSGNDEQNRVP